MFAEVNNNISRFSYSRSVIKRITTLSKYYNKSEQLSQCSFIVQCDSTTGLKLYNKSIKNGYLWNNFKTRTSTSNTLLSENRTDQPSIIDANFTPLATYLIIILKQKHHIYTKKMIDHGGRVAALYECDDGLRITHH